MLYSLNLNFPNTIYKIFFQADHYIYTTVMNFVLRNTIWNDDWEIWEYFQNLVSATAKFYHLEIIN